MLTLYILQKGQCTSLSGRMRELLLENKIEAVRLAWWLSRISCL